MRNQPLPRRDTCAYVRRYGEIAAERGSLTEDDFYMYLVPIEKAIGEEDELMKWAEEKHEKIKLLSL